MARFLVDGFNLHDVEFPRRTQIEALAVARDGVQMHPAIALTQPGECAIAIQPVHVVARDQPGVVLLHHQRPHCTRCGIAQQYAIRVLPPVLVLQQHLRVAGPVHARHVVFARVAGEREPLGSGRVDRNHAHTNRGIRGPGFRVTQWDWCGVLPARIPDHVEGADAAGVELPVGDAARVRAPRECLAERELLLVGEISASIENEIAAVGRQADHGRAIDGLDVEIVVSHIRDACSVGRKLGMQQAARWQLAADLTQRSCPDVVQPAIADRVVPPGLIGSDSQQEHATVGRPFMIDGGKWFGHARRRQRGGVNCDRALARCHVVSDDFHAIIAIGRFFERRIRRSVRQPANGCRPIES